MDRNRPLIGITAYEVPASFSHWHDMPAVMVPAAYSQSVVAAGGLPVVIPPVEGTADLLDQLQGLVLSGGSDLDAGLYGEQQHPETLGVIAHRDRSELELLAAALDRDLPVLGICRGMQVLNVACGGTLEQHLPDVLGHDGHAGEPGRYADHDVRVEQDSLAARAVGEERAAVKSYHHQGVRTLGDGLRATGFSLLDDGIVEAIELPGRPFALGVLWHPEEDDRSRVVAALVAAARERTAVVAK
jgi:putative glutamine amidotransferase